jgi:alkylation response protein AidB-like acyl-CoA dehydrogenase
MRADIEGALERASSGLRDLDLGDAFEPRAAAVLVDAGLAGLCVPASAGGMGATLGEAAEVLLVLGAIDGSTALGFAMQVHVTGALRDGIGIDDGVRSELWARVVQGGALLNNAATEEGGGSPARGAIPGTVARLAADGTWRLRGEKTWTTWLPNLACAFVTARLEAAGGGESGEGADDGPLRVGTFLVDLAEEGVERLAGFEAMGVRGSASGRLVLADARGRLVLERAAGAPDPRGAAPMAWFGVTIAATYLGIGEGARRDVARWALDRRPGDGAQAVADIPSVQLRLGRLDAALRTARIVVLEAARRWDADRDPSLVALAKVTATRAAVDATDEALRIAGGPGFLVGRLERAFRDSRAGLINPPLEDVALQGFARAVLDAERGRP